MAPFGHPGLETTTEVDAKFALVTFLVSTVLFFVVLIRHLFFLPNSSSSKALPRIRALNVFPIKSAQGIAHESCTITAKGLQYDRTWMIVDEDGAAVTQREAPRLAEVQPTIDTSDEVNRSLLVDAPRMKTLVLPLDTCRCDSYSCMCERPTPVPVAVSGVPCSAADCGDSAAEWFQKCLGRDDVRLVRASGLLPSRRLVDDPAVRALETVREGDVCSFADKCPFRVSSLASPDPDQKNDLLRANIVVENTEDEDTWELFVVRRGIGVEFRTIHPCLNDDLMLDIGMTEEEKGELQREYEQVKGELPAFGIHCVCDRVAGGVLSVGDEIEVTRRVEKS